MQNKQKLDYVVNIFTGYNNTHLMALCPGLPGSASTRKVKPIWIILKQQTLVGSGISWTICKSAPRPRQIPVPAPHHSIFTGQRPFLPPKQQCQSTEGHRAVMVIIKPCFYRITQYK